MAKKKDTGTDEASATRSRLTPIDVQQKEFRVSRFGGYKMRDVDEFLDHITDTFTSLTVENDRLRTGAAGPVVGSPDLDSVARQADEIIARARAEAARITGEARAATSAAPVSTSGPTDRAAVNAFLSREREFLQSLAGLVQEHAEAVKGMARSARAPSVPASASAKSAPAAAATPAGGTATSSESLPGPQGGSGPARGEPTTVPEPEATVRIEEPASAVAARGDGDPESDPSLRELFWGED